MTDPSSVIIPAGAVTIPGNGWQYVLDSDYPREVPERWTRLTAEATTRRYGRSGYQWVSGLARADDLVDLFEYVESAAGAQEAALDDQRGDPESYASVRRDAVGLRRGAQRLQAALRFYGVEALTFDERRALRRQEERTAR